MSKVSKPRNGIRKENLRQWEALCSVILVVHFKAMIHFLYRENITFLLQKSESFLLKRHTTPLSMKCDSIPASVLKEGKLKYRDAKD